MTDINATTLTECSKKAKVNSDSTIGDNLS